MTVKTQDILEDIHRMKRLAIRKGYALSSLVLLIDEDARHQLKQHPDYHTYCTADEIMGIEWVLALYKKPDQRTFHYDLVVKLGAAEHIEGVPSEEFTICGKEPEGVY